MTFRIPATFVLLLAVASASAAPPLVTGASEAPERRAGEALCGPEIVLLGDAWEHVQLERDVLHALVHGGELVRVPQRTAALASHLAFMQNRSLMVFGEARQRLDAGLLALAGTFSRWNALALADERAPLLREWPDFAARLNAIGAQYPEEALISSSATSFLLPPVVPTMQIRLLEPPRLEAGRETTVRFRLLSPAGQGVISDALHTTHTQKLHALVLDPLFRDYHHDHPQPTGEPGEYTFKFTPRVNGPCRLWLDAMPVATGRGEFPVADLAKIPRPIAKAPAPAEPVLRAIVDDWICELALPANGLVFGQLNTASLTLRDRAGQPVTRLQPFMGAFAHIVGFAEDYYTILHIHPLGPMPRPEDLGGPKIDFQLRPTLPGWLRLYVQFVIDGRVHLAHFTVPVIVR